MSAAQPQPIRIALAEDSPDQRAALTSLLKAANYDVVCAASHGTELVKFCLKEDVDVVIADLDMPEMDGLEAAEALAHRSIPVILLSGHSDAREIRTEHEPLAARLLKPVKLERLQAEIEHALALKRDPSPEPQSRQ